MSATSLRDSPQLNVPVRDEPMLAVSLMLGASLSFAAMNAVSSWLGRRGVPWETTAFARAAGGLMFVLVVARARGASLVVHDKVRMWHRSVGGSVALLCTFYSLRNLPLSDAMALLNTTPVWTALFAYVFLREGAGGRVLVAMAVALIGVALIERPTFLSGNVAGLIALTAGVVSAYSMISLRRLKGETPEAVVVHFSTFASLVTGTLLLVRIVRSGGHPALGLVGMLGLLLVGLTATGGQLLMTRAYALDRAARVGAAGGIQVIMGLGIDWLVFGRGIPWLTMAGIVLVVGSGIGLFLDARWESRRIRSIPG